MPQTVRRPTRTIRVGSLKIGGNAPITVQSMTNVFTHEIDRCVEQIQSMAERGCELVRVAVPTPKDTAIAGNSQTGNGADYSGCPLSLCPSAGGRQSGCA